MMSCVPAYWQGEAFQGAEFGSQRVPYWYALGFSVWPRFWFLACPSA